MGTAILVHLLSLSRRGLPPENARVVWSVDSGSKHSSFIIITTRGEENSRDEGLSKGADAYLTKPISGPKLVTSVKELL